MTESDIEVAYRLVKAQDGQWDSILPGRDESPTNIGSLRRICEMILVRTYDDWYAGKVDHNISRAIHRYVERLNNNRRRPLSIIRRAAALLAYTYVAIDHDSDDAYLLMTHVLDDLGPNGDSRIISDSSRLEMTRMLERWRSDRGLPPSLEALTVEERDVWDEISRWEIEPSSILDELSERVDGVRDAAFEHVPESMTRVVSDATYGAIKGMQDASARLVRENAILDEVRRAGHPVESIGDLRLVPMDLLDKIASNSRAGAKVLAGLEGIGTGSGGILFAVADVPALMMINLRYIGQIAATYGFDIEREEEQAYALNILGFASADRVAKIAFLHELNKIAIDVARRKTWDQLNQRFAVQLMRKIAEFLGIRLTKRKLAQMIPVVGAVIGGGVNYGFTHDNLTAAFMLYRKRYLIEKCLRSS